MRMNIKKHQKIISIEFKLFFIKLFQDEKTRTFMSMLTY
jgi:hypothetical protein